MHSATSYPPPAMVHTSEILDNLIFSIASYASPQRVKRDCLSILTQFPNLSPAIQQSANSSQSLILTGGFPVVFRGSNYNVSIRIEINESYPYSPPIVTVAPSSNEVIAQDHYYVDSSGLVRVPMLQYWTESSSILQLCQELRQAFSENLPIQTVSSQISSSLSPRSSLTQMNDSTTNSLPPAYYNTQNINKISGSLYPNTSRDSQSNMPNSRHVHYTLPSYSSFQSSRSPPDYVNRKTSTLPPSYPGANHVINQKNMDYRPPTYFQHQHPNKSPTNSTTSFSLGSLLSPEIINLPEQNMDLSRFPDVSEGSLDIMDMSSSPDKDRSSVSRNSDSDIQDAWENSVNSGSVECENDKGELKYNNDDTSQIQGGVDETRFSINSLNEEEAKEYKNVLRKQLAIKLYERIRTHQRDCGETLSESITETTSLSSLVEEFQQSILKLKEEKERLETQALTVLNHEMEKVKEWIEYNQKHPNPEKVAEFKIQQQKKQQCDNAGDDVEMLSNNSNAEVDEEVLGRYEEVTTPKNPLLRQKMLEEAQVLAKEDCYYCLDKGLQLGILDVSTYLKTMRNIAHDQFLSLALLKKIEYLSETEMAKTKRLLNTSDPPLRPNHSPPRI